LLQIKIVNFQPFNCEPPGKPLRAQAQKNSPPKRRAVGFFVNMRSSCCNHAIQAISKRPSSRWEAVGWNRVRSIRLSLNILDAILSCIDNLSIMFGSICVF